MKVHRGTKIVLMDISIHFELEIAAAENHRPIFYSLGKAVRGCAVVESGEMTFENGNSIHPTLVEFKLHTHISPLQLMSCLHHFA